MRNNVVEINTKMLIQLLARCWTGRNYSNTDIVLQQVGRYVFAEFGNRIDDEPMQLSKDYDGNLPEEPHFNEDLDESNPEV